MTAVFFVPLDRLREVLSPQARVYEILPLGLKPERLHPSDPHWSPRLDALSSLPRCFVVLPPKGKK